VTVDLKNLYVISQGTAMNIKIPLQYNNFENLDIIKQLSSYI